MNFDRSFADNDSLWWFVAGMWLAGAARDHLVRYITLCIGAMNSVRSVCLQCLACWSAAVLVLHLSYELCSFPLPNKKASRDLYSSFRLHCATGVMNRTSFVPFCLLCCCVEFVATDGIALRQTFKCEIFIQRESDFD